MKRLILVFVLIIAVIIAMFAYIQDYYTYNDVSSTIHRIISNAKNSDKETKSEPDIKTIKTDNNKSPILDKRIIPKTQKKGLNKCINNKQKTVYTQFSCPEGYTLVRDNWAEKANVMSPDESSEKNKEE